MNLNILQFLQEENGQYSSARLLSFLTVGCFMWDWTMHILRNIDFEPSITVVGLVFGIVLNKTIQSVWGEKPTNIDNKLS